MRAMDEREVDRLIARAVPGEIRANSVFGSGPGEIGYAAIVSELDGEFFVSFIEFYDPRVEAPKPQYGVPPTPEGLAVTYRESYPTELAAGQRHGFFTALITEQSRMDEEGFEPGLAYLLKVVDNHKGRILAERAYEAGTDELDDPGYQRRIEEDLAEQVPGEINRESLRSWARFKHRGK